MTDPLGQSQVLSYLILLSKLEYSFDIISLDKPNLLSDKRKEVEQMIGKSDINWHPIEFESKTPILSTFKNLKNVWQKAQSLQKSNDNFKIIHGRGLLPTLVGTWYKHKFGVKVLFDMRGWFADERKESASFNGLFFYPIYKYLKYIERKVFFKSDLAISLTFIGKKILIDEQLKNEDKIEVIPTCVNFELFKPFSEKIKKEIREELKIPLDSKVMLYSGSLGGSYRTDLLLLFFKELLKINPNSYFIFLTHSNHSIAKQEIEKSKIPLEKFRIVSTSFSNVYRYLMAGDIGLIMYSKAFSVSGRSPTKLGEYWSAGLPVLSAKGIGDLEQIIQKYPNSGVLVSDIEATNEFGKAVENIINMNIDKAQIRKYAIDYFDINNGIKSYQNIYNKLLEN